MSDDVVRAEAQAVRSLRQAVGRYAENMRDAMAQARRDVAAADRNTREAVDQRRTELHRREQELRAAQAALANCRENCGGLQRQVAEAAERQAGARLRLDRARTAADLATAAQHNLLSALSHVEGTVGEHASVASTALADLDARLTELPSFGIGHAVQQALASAAIGVEVLGAGMAVGRMAGNALKVADIDIPIRDHTVAEFVERRDDTAKDYVVHNSREEQEHLNRSQKTEGTP